MTFLYLAGFWKHYRQIDLFCQAVFLGPNKSSQYKNYEFTRKFILFSCFLRLHYFLFFLSFSFSCVIFKLIECKKNLVPFCTFSLTFSLIFKNWNSLSFGFMAKVKKRKEIALQDRETLISFRLHFLKPVKTQCVDLFKWKKSQKRRDFTFIVIIFS